MQGELGGVFVDMKILKSEKRFCTCCMEEHEVKSVLVRNQSTFKNVKVDFEASYLYCDKAEELYMDEQMMQENDVRLKDAYRKAEGLLTSAEIIALRAMYGISQSDLCLLLGWGGKTITRYESHQVQDKAHDTILKKLEQDPEWFLSLLNDAKENLSTESYQKYLEVATALYEKDQDFYLRKAIEASYARFHGNQMFHGNTELSLDKVVDVIRYFAASTKITSLYKVKLMKLMWYADAFSYKKRGFAITGLVYQALPMGAVPVGHNSIIDLSDVPCEEVDMGETNAYHFSLEQADSFPTLSDEDINILDIVIEKLGKMSKNEIVSFMHKERAYIETAPRDVISFKYAENLQI
jgi:putative zinc finger/helix-turn-helix YgiT family protein